MKKSSAETLQKSLSRQLIILSGIIMVSFAAANLAGTATIPLILKLINNTQGSAPISHDRNIFKVHRSNFFQIKKNIKERNLFNLSGEFPNEEEQKSQIVEKTKEDFDLNAACNPPSIKLDLIGTIDIGPKNSIATIKESTGEAEVYQVGETILDHENIQIVKIDRNMVVLNNLGVKECLVIDVEKAIRGREVEIIEGLAEEPAQPQEQLTEVNASFVESELGDGFSKILQSARLVPNTKNDIVGFKVFDIKAGTLLDKIGLKNGDIITHVNNTNLTPEQGFSLYQALMDEKEILIRVVNSQNTPSVLRVFIK